jgi:Asp-tRNA(Asn)/Glu-tRNA(Gln) amidotransferase A subunit family amidase
VPALSLPSGTQLISRWWDERALVEAAVAVEAP